jgi:hypothetical protein
VVRSQVRLWEKGSTALVPPPAVRRVLLQDPVNDSRMEANDPQRTSVAFLFIPVRLGVGRDGACGSIGCPVGKT